MPSSERLTMVTSLLLSNFSFSAFFQRTYAPEISLGMQSAEELYDEAELVDTKLNNAPAASPENIAAEMEKQENANTETLGMGDGKAADPAPAAPASPANDGNAAPAGGVKPMGAQKVPDMFK